mgnify:CR=1 FL=1
MKVGIAIPVHNRRNTTLQALGSIARAARIMSKHLQAVVDRALILEKPKQVRDIRTVLSTYADAPEGKRRKSANGKRTP